MMNAWIYCFKKFQQELLTYRHFLELIFTNFVDCKVGLRSMAKFLLLRSWLGHKMHKGNACSHNCCCCFVVDGFIVDKVGFFVAVSVSVFSFISFKFSAYNLQVF